MYNCEDNSGYIRLDYSSDSNLAAVLNLTATNDSSAPRVQHNDSMGGYVYPILDWFLSQIGSGYYQILKCNRSKDPVNESELRAVLEDPNTLYSYPDGNKITIVQFSNWDNTQSSLSDLGVEIVVDQKLFKRIKTFNRRFRAYHSCDRPVRVCIIPDDQHSSYSEYLSPEQKEMLLDGAFIISPSIVAKCMAPFDHGVKIFSDDKVFATKEFNRNIEIGNYYRNSKIFNARVFGPIEVINEGNPEDYAPFVGAIKGQAYIDHSGMCDYFGVDVIAPYSAFKKEVNISTRSFFLIEPQNAKLGRMFSDGQTIVNLPALYNWRDIKHSLSRFYRAEFDKLVNNQMLEQWSDMSFAMFDPNKPKMFDSEDIASLTTWNVRSWLLCGGKLSHSPWLFAQMGKNFLASMRVEDERKMRFPVDCAARALVITESLLRALKGLRSDGDDIFRVEPGEARWDTDLSVLVVNDYDYVEMYPSHGGCDLDDFFQIYWRTLNGEKVIIIVRSPNDWGEYSIFKYHEGDWHSKTDDISFPEVSNNPAVWPKRLSEALKDNDVQYTGLPKAPDFDGGTEYNADYIWAAINATSDSAASVGINVNARQLWSSTMRAHRPEQVCSMEDAIDSGVQGGTDEQVNAVIEEGTAIVDEIVNSGVPVDAFLWLSKHAHFYKDAQPKLVYTNISYLQKVRVEGAKWFRQQYQDYANSIPSRVNYGRIHKLGKKYINQGISTLKWYRRSLYEQNSSYAGSPDWENTIDLVINEIMKHEEGHDRNTFVIALYSACLITPLSSGQVSDQFVMQPKMFPLLMEALQFYGLIGYLKLSPETGELVRAYNTEWREYDQVSGKMVTYDNPYDYQAAYFSSQDNVNTAES